MNKRIKKLWIKALRSGKYKQGKNALHPSPDTFCCLGVLCDLYRKHEKGIEWEGDGGEAYFDGEDAALPPSVREWAGIDDSDPKLGDRVSSATAAKLNDRNETFEYIAGRTEKYL